MTTPVPRARPVHPPRPLRRNRLRTAGLVAAALVAGALSAIAPTAGPAAAASLVQVTGFGNNPGNLSMHVYVPGSVQAHPGIVVAMHPCGGSGPGFYQSSEFASLADRYGFIVIYPTSTKKIGCFDTWSDASKHRGGGTDAESIVSMVTYTEQHWNGDPGRVFATGSSSGAMMTDAVVALYPDVFKAGSAFMGVPFGCFPNEADYLASNSVCAGGNNTKSPQQWGDLVRAAYPGYSGPYPRMQLWHGTADTVVNYRNLQMEVDQWTNVHGLGQTPTSTDTPQSGWTRRSWAGPGGTTLIEAITVSGAGHSLPSAGMAARAIAFFGLDGPPPTTPTTPTTPPTTTRTTPPTTTTTAPTTTTPPTTTTTAAPPTTTTTPPGSSATCRVTYAGNPWNTGLTANLTITNTGTTAVDGWTLVFTLASGQTLTGGWNATYTGSSGQITARNASYNGALAAGASTTIGYQATHTGNSSGPASFTLNGTRCDG
jgi:poly(hydroxyalkanoate) depolymerase family esterase